MLKSNKNMDKTELYILIIIAIAIASFIYQIYFSKKRNSYYNELTNSLINKDYNKFDKLIKSKEISKFLQPFNICYLKLNKAIISENKVLINSAFDNFDKLNLNDKQKHFLYTKALYYYAAEDKKRATQYYNCLKNTKNINIYDIDRVYDTLVLNGYKYLDESLNELSTSIESNKSDLMILISNMYANKNDKDNAKKYLEMATKFISK